MLLAHLVYRKPAGGSRRSARSESHHERHIPTDPRDKQVPTFRGSLEAGLCKWGKQAVREAARSSGVHIHAQFRPPRLESNDYVCDHVRELTDRQTTDYYLK
ncbi:MAG TPA: hypothetical protein VFO36_02110, partial [Nitrospiraceae bacterium]|nr:hypothetical protein [Nitrospiraceae bacterium]